MWIVMLIDEEDYIRGFELRKDEAEARELKSWWSKNNPNWKAVMISLNALFNYLVDSIYELFDE